MTQQSADEIWKTFHEVHDAEIDSIEKLRKSDSDPELNDDSVQNRNTIKGNLIGLAISGGGIRSASFALGALEAMKKHGLLKKIDYLSTVSGGGYIGSWLSANCLRHGRNWLEESAVETNTEWQESVAHLRRYSNYLSPKVGFFSADTWAMLTVWLRNTLLIQLMIVFAIAGVLAAPHLLAYEAGNIIAENYSLGPIGGFNIPVSWITSLFLLVIVVWITWNINSLADDAEEGQQQKSASGNQQIEDYTEGGWLHVFIILVMVLCLCISGLLWAAAAKEQTYSICLTNLLQRDWRFLICGVIGFTLFAYCSRRRGMTADAGLAYYFVAILPATLVLGLLLAAITLFLGGWKGWPDNVGGGILAFTWAPPLVAASLSLAINVLIGMQGVDSYESVREWWSRFGAWLAIYGAGWMMLVVVAFYGPYWLSIISNDNFWTTTLTSGWLGTTLAGLFAGKSESTRGVAEDGLSVKTKEFLAKAAPFVFIIGLLFAVSGILNAILAENSWKGKAETDYWQSLAAITSDSSRLLMVFLVCGLLTLLFSKRVDINEFSLNAFYRNRLTRCYLGATRMAGAKDRNGQSDRRQPHPFTGFDNDDDLKLTELLGNGNQPFGPYHIFNCALNLGGSSDLTVHTRHCADFALTPLYSGSSYIPREAGGKPISCVRSPHGDSIGYWSTADFGGTAHQPRVGLAVSVSGAAASPNMGYHTSASVAFLMTLFNARLGWWFPNPGRWLFNEQHKHSCNKPSPAWSLEYLRWELFGNAQVTDDFLAISDGGHFENMGAYELIKRRCRLIIVCDGECDEQLRFEGLANLIRLSEVDLDADIEIDVRDVHPQAKGNDQEKWSKRRFAFGKISYRNQRFPGGPETGWLIYIKACMNGQEATPILQYRAAHPEFPHESTSNQFYREDQFESYRNLGKDIADILFKEMDGIGNKTRAEIIGKLEYLYLTTQFVEEAT